MALVLPMALAGTTMAQTCTVTSTADSGAGTLRSCLTNASGGETITFGVTGTITLTTGTLTVSVPVTVQGPGANLLTVSGANQFTVFTLNRGIASISISGLTIANGNRTVGGILGAVGGNGDNSDAVTVSNSTFFGNTSNGAVIEEGIGGATSGNGGGGISNNGVLTVTNSSFNDNSNSSGVLTVDDSTFSANSSGSAGGGAFLSLPGW
jgi:hypothetical protein